MRTFRGYEGTHRTRLSTMNTYLFLSTDSPAPSLPEEEVPLPFGCCPFCGRALTSRRSLKC